jgi:hypothetical protein
MSRPGKATAKRKERRAKSWKKAQDKKAQNILEQEERTKINAEYRKRGERTPSQQRKREAFERRLTTERILDAATRPVVE